jgi:hypothetical protein
VTLLINAGLRGALQVTSRLDVSGDVGVGPYAVGECWLTMAGIMKFERVAGAVLAVCALALAGCSNPAGTPSDGATASRASAYPSSTTQPEADPGPSDDDATTSASGKAAAMAAQLPVKGRAPKTGYTRSQFGQAWADADRNGCDTRNDILAAQLTAVEKSGRCKVMSAVLADDPYTGQRIVFIRGASKVDIDHVVALGDAWQKGAAAWPFAKRVAYANDPAVLLAVDSSANRQKGDGDAATWLPANKAYRCAYVARQVMVKHKYGLWVTAAEKEAMLRVLSSCPGQSIPDPGPAPTLAPNVGSVPAPAVAS